MSNNINGMRKEGRDDYQIPDITIADPRMQTRHTAYIERFAQNHGLTIEETLKHPMIKAHAVFCANSHPDMFIRYMKEG